MIYTPDKIRNIAIVGHQGSGKTSLVESIAFKGGVIPQKGTVEAKNTLSDYLPDEQKKQTSLSTAVVPVLYHDYKFNLIDLPGNDDFVYEMLGVSRLIKGAVLVIDASKGVQIGTIKNFKALRKRNVPIFVYVNKMDKENIDFPALYEEIKEKLSKNCVPFSYPIGKQDSFDGFINIPEMKARKYNGKECVDDVIYEEKRQVVFELYNRLAESVATTSDELLEKFFSGEPLTKEEIKAGLRQGVLNGELFPVIVGSAIKDIGINTMMDMFIDYLPSPADLKPITAFDEAGKEVEIPTSNEEPASLCVFKNTYNTYQGLISIFKVNSGIVKLGDTLHCPNNGEDYRISSLFSICGEKLTPVTEISAGDIGAFTKMENIKLSNTLCAPTRIVKFKPVNYPTATYLRGIVPATKNDSDKLFPAVEKLQMEDPTILFEKNAITNQILIGSLSSSHLTYILEKIKDNKINFTTEKPKIVYKETITAKGESEGRYIKQSGGSGYYGVVNMSFEPSDKIEFASTVFGGHIDKGYFPAVEKGFIEALEHGGLVGAPVINVKATLTDGKQHTVDSNEMAFKNAAILAFRQAYKDCKPILLEPYDRMVVNVPSEYLGAILSDLGKRRGKIISTEEGGDDSFDITAIVPEAEILEYANELKSITKGTGFFNIEFEDYEKVPDVLAETVIKEYKA
ncbi:MAG: elongation factor G [Candidatus Enterosoma sp.]|nr:elongation factor G [bacterium]MDY4188017.1 elongation factor G [Candidatus Enterosoma sp.]MDD7572569.1 elongation factor G [bacterium]MDY5256881.1 elongation factor G [Candidatus Enterosoma sp.]MDY5322912.1 elongation factor G [Candidatus Enterosoma sp.]